MLPGTNYDFKHFFTSKAYFKKKEKLYQGYQFSQIDLGRTQLDGDNYEQSAIGKTTD